MHVETGALLLVQSKGEEDRRIGHVVSTMIVKPGDFFHLGNQMIVSAFFGHVAADSGEL